MYTELNTNHEQIFFSLHDAAAFCHYIPYHTPTVYSFCRGLNIYSATYLFYQDCILNKF